MTLSQSYLTDLSIGPTDPTVKRKRAVNKAVKSLRIRKSKSQLDALQKEYDIKSEWQNEDFIDISRRLGLKRKQVYKWYWDQKKKLGELKTKQW